MKIAILGSAPSSLGLAPIGNPAYKIWGCSPGVYASARRCDAWFELHRWEPGKIGIAESQKTWFSPEYVQWMAMRVPDGQPGACPVWMYEPVPEIPASKALPIDELIAKYGTFFFTSSISIMIACAIEDILEARAGVPVGPNGYDDEIALYGVDMSANEEYGYQRAGCQHMLLLAADLGIAINVPHESDLLRPMPIYGLCENTHWHIKNIARQRELQQRLAQAQGTVAAANNTVQFMMGALDDLNYQMLTWGEDRTGMGVDPRIFAAMPKVQQEVYASMPKAAPHNTPEGVEGIRLLEIVSSRSEKGEAPEVTLRRLLAENEATKGLAERKPRRKPPTKKPRKR